MAHMIPAAIRADTKSSAEKALFPLLRDQLSEEFTVFHSLKFMPLKESGRITEIEIDFTVFSPNMGFLIIEAKSGFLRFDGSSGCWYQNANQLERGPFEQASSAKHEFKKYLKGKVKNIDRIPFGHAVCLPDCSTLPLNLPPNFSKEICIFGSHLNSLENLIPEIMAKSQEPDFSCVSAEQLAQIKRTLMPLCDFGAALKDTISQAEQQFFELTEEQCRLLDFIRQYKKALIKGCAGSGKTIMAFKKAAGLANAGYKVLLLAYNELLSQDLAKKAKADDIPNITVNSFHGFCEQILRECGQLPAGIQDSNYYETILPDAMADLLTRNPMKYDAVIIDEGQDFKTKYWDIVIDLIRRDGYFYVFLDPEQNIFSGQFPHKFDSPPFELNVNCRNTVKICEVLKHYTDWNMESKPNTPQGADVSIYCLRDPSVRRGQLSKILHKLIVDEGIEREKIVVLGGHDSDKTCIPPDGRVGSFVVAKEASSLPNGVDYCTYLKFKGCEREFVILIDVNEADERWSKRGMYTSASRAIQGLYIIKASA